MDVKILVRLSSRSRPEKLISCVNNIVFTIGIPLHDYALQLVLDDDDEITNQIYYKKRIKAFEQVLPLVTSWGKSRSKIDAFNRHVPPTGWKLVVATSDDIEFLPEWGKKLLFDYEVNGPDHVFHYLDGYPHGEILTVPIYDFEYYQRDKYIYHPDYVSLYCDEEAIAVGKARGRIVHGGNGLFIHRNPVWTGGERDEQFKRTQGYHPIDQKTFIARKARNFDL